MRKQRNNIAATHEDNTRNICIHWMRGYEWTNIESVSSACLFIVCVYVCVSCGFCWQLLGASSACAIRACVCVFVYCIFCPNYFHMHGAHERGSHTCKHNHYTYACGTVPKVHAPDMNDYFDSNYTHSPLAPSGIADFIIDCVLHTALYSCAHECAPCDAMQKVRRMTDNLCISWELHSSPHQLQTVPNAIGLSTL